MIIVKILGGLGNQMFQYATAKAIAHRSKQELKLDLTGFPSYEHHSYALNRFSILETPASKEEVLAHTRYTRLLDGLPHYPKRALEKIKADAMLRSLDNYTKEPSFRFNARIRDLRRSTYLDGYWQSEKYFSDIRPILKHEFRPKAGLSQEAAQIAKEIESTKNPICVHVRRGDFASNSKVSKYHGVCPLEYYYEAIQKMPSGAGTRFFVFSDSIDWARENLRLEHPATYVGRGADNNHEDITLMTYCKNFILSNSSFGWWGAWLSDAQEKVVVAPKKWTNTDIDTTDLIPDSWMRI